MHSAPSQVASSLRIGQHNLQKVNSKINWQVGKLTEPAES